MGARELFVLGTASQVPTRYRNHNAYFLRWDEEGILFDPGEGTQRQLTLAGLSAHSITRICITHFHGDHCLGLPGIIQRLSLEACPEVTVYYPASGQRYFENLRSASIYARLEKLVTVPISRAGVLFESDSCVLEAAALDHDVECFGYRVRERDALRVRQERLKATGVSGRAVGELLRAGSIVAPDGRVVRRSEITEVKPGQSFAFIMDTRRCAGAEELALGADLLVCESTFLRSETELAGIAGHLTASQAAELARDLGARRLVLTHFSQRYDDANAFLEEAREVHDDVVVAAEPDAADAASTRHRIAVPERRQIRFRGQFEAHITVNTEEPQKFSDACERLGMKCILIELAEGAEPNHPMTESHHEGDLNVVRAEVDGLVDSLVESGFDVRRRKIEARYDADGVPIVDEDTRGLPPSCYFEYHVVVRIAGKSRVDELRQLALLHGAHLSRNARKASEKFEERFVTLRVPRAGRQRADASYAAMVDAIRGGAFEMVGERREFTVYDSNLDLDRGWL